MLFSLKAMNYWLSLTYWQVWKYDTYHKGSQITLMYGNKDNTMHFSASIGMGKENLVNPKPPPRLSGFVALWQVLGFIKPWLTDPLSTEVKIHTLEIIPKVWSALTFFFLCGQIFHPKVEKNSSEPLGSPSPCLCRYYLHARPPYSFRWIKSCSSLILFFLVSAGQPLLCLTKLNRMPATCWEALVGTGFESRWVWISVAVPVAYLAMLSFWLACRGIK